MMGGEGSERVGENLRSECFAMANIHVLLWLGTIRLRC